jgi:Sulfotransferase domain
MFIISTPQRCGSTWLTRMMALMTDSRDVYMDGLKMGFRLAAPCDAGAVEKLGEFLRKEPPVKVIKTHDIPSAQFDAVCAAYPDVRILTMHRDFRDTVVSRYFYLRYYRQSIVGLDALSPAFREFLMVVGGMSDAEALVLLLETPCVRGWAREWAAFEGPFKSPNAIRITYDGMLDESDFPKLVEFSGLPLRKHRPFEIEQQAETAKTGRDGSARFNRKGRSGEWRDWFSREQGERLHAMANDECRRQHGE